jgi:glycosyltransferase involved in cell wall biosynthesis
MRIAFFTDTFVPQINGVATTLSKLVDYMNDKHIEYKIFAPAFKENDFYHNVIRSKSIKLILYPQCRFSFPNYLSIARELDEFNPDIVHAVTEFNMGLCGIRYAKTRNIPFVTSYETNVCQYLEYYKLKLLEAPSWKYLRWFHDKSDKVLCPSKATMNFLTNQGFSNLDLWERGIETDTFSPNFRDSNLRNSLGVNNKTVLTYVGRVSPEKDLHIFVNTAKMLNKQFKKDIHFIIVGDGPSLKDLKESAPDNFTFTGFMKGEELSKIYASSDIFLFPSATETLGFVILEAMASGLAVISCNGGGVSDNLIDGYNGLACREKNESDFFNAAKKLILNKSYKSQLAHNARDFALTKSWNSSFDKLILNYEKIVYDKNLLNLINCS